MPFNAEELRQRFAASIKQGRMGHSYLLTGDRAESLEQLALGLAAQVLGKPPLTHPDFHAVRPESKSRHITVDQMRELERELYLKPYASSIKVAVVFDAERMCLGGAAAANAFLKTLEEPPAHTLILLTSGRPAMLLPTIISRCLRLDLGFEDIDAGAVHEPQWIAAWYTVKAPPALRVYARANVLHDHWAEIREKAESHLKSHDDVEEDVAKALVEAEFQLGRQESIAQLQRWYWRRSEKVAQTTEPERLRAVKALEELQAALAQNIDAHLAVETACLRVEGLL